jgi:predicted permease
MLRIRGGSYEVVGVARPGFDGLGSLPADLWVTRRAAGATVPDTTERVGVVARLQSGVTPEQAEAEMLGRARQLTADRPEALRIVAVQLTSAATAVPHDARFIAAVAPIMAAFALVLLIVCANVANMMLARAVSRQREIGIRLSIGATRGRLIRQLITESTLLAVPAMLAGFVISMFIVRAAERAIQATLPAMLGGWFRPLNLAPDGRVFLFGCAICIAAVLACGLIPALRLTRPNVIPAVGGESIQSVSASRLRHALAIAQVTVCLVLLICAGVFLQTSRQFAQHDSGMALRGVMSLQFKPSTPEGLIQRLERELTNTSWVQSTAVAMRAPVAESLASLSIATTGDSTEIRSRYNSISSSYLPLLGIPIVRGRNFTAQETESGADVVILSETTARELWPNGDELGRSVRINRSPSESRIARVIGTAKDVSGGKLFERQDSSLLYCPTHAGDAKSHLLLVKFTDDSNATHRAFDDLLEKVAPEAVQSTVTLQGLVDTQRWPFRIGFIVTAFLGTLALLLTVSGIYGVLAYMVASRTREVGVRMALGATVSSVVRIVLLQSMRLTLVGMSIGLVLALGLSRLFAAAIEAVDTFDLAAYLGGVTAVLLAAIAAAYFPSRRAARVDPVVALRAD